MLRNKLMPTVVLSAICIIAVALLSAVNLITEPAIIENQEKRTNAALLEVMPYGGSFEKINDVDGLPDAVDDVYKSSDGKGYVFRLNATGYKSGLVIMCGIDGDGKITGTKCIQSSETNGAEGKLSPMYVGKTEGDYSSVEIISGSTLTSKGYKNAMKSAFDAFEILTGGDGE